MSKTEHRAISDDKNGFVVAVKLAAGEKCQRCWNITQDVDVHMYWPTWRICKRCVGALLEMHTAPFIERSNDDYYICKDEKEWWEIRAGRKKLPLEPDSKSLADVVELEDTPLPKGGAQA